MRADRLAQLTLGALALAFLVVALQGLLVPTLLMAPVEIQLETTSGLAEVRAGYGGCFGGLAALFLVGARRASLMRPALGVGALVLGLFVVGRLVSLTFDGTPNLFSWAVLGAEAFGFGMCLLSWRRAT